MEERQIDVLLAQGDNDNLGGYVRYLTDVPVIPGNPVTVLFPRDADMTVVAHGPSQDERRPKQQDDVVFRGAQRVLTSPYFSSVCYTSGYDASLIADALMPYAHARIGLVNPRQISAAMLDHLRKVHAHAVWVDASEPVDAIKMVKSPEEQALIRRTAEVQDAALAAAFGSVEAGMKESDVVAVARHAAERLGSEAGYYLCASSPSGDPHPIAPRHQQARVLRDGDSLALLVECNGPGGYYAELGRTCVLGEAPRQLVEELDFVLEAQRHTVERLRTGASCAEIWEQYNAYLRDNGRPEERRLHSHGQGYDLVERPLIRFDETLAVAEGLNLACHPTYVKGGVLAWICDNYLIGEHGAERIHAYPQKIVEL